MKVLVICLLAMLLSGCSDLENYLERKFGSVVFFTISASASLLCFRSARKSNKMFEMMESIPISPISEIQGGPTEIRGKVKAQEDVLVCPWGKKGAFITSSKSIKWKVKTDPPSMSGRNSPFHS